MPSLVSFSNKAEWRRERERERESRRERERERERGTSCLRGAVAP